jgi:hypothetical protein
VDLGGVAPDAGGFVGGDEVVLPALPELEGYVEEFGGALVAGGVGRLAVEAEVAGGLGSGGGDDVPAGPAAADVVEGGEAAGEVVRGVVGGGGGGDQADVLRGDGQRGEQGDGFEYAGGALAERC